MPITTEAPYSGTSAVYDYLGLAKTSAIIGTDWEFHQGQLGSLWEIWRGDKATDNVSWTPVTLPHCFNARDSVDPDVSYYQGPGWYRTKLNINNPYPNGRTLVHFNGTGQKAQVFVGMQKVGEHNGGYDEWTVDITEASAAALSDPENQGQTRFAVLCDNSRDAESIPSDLSDFNRYGGIYRHEFVTTAVIDGLMRVQMDSEVPVFSAVLTPRDFHEHGDHVEFFRQHFVKKGVEVAHACLSTLDQHAKVDAFLQAKAA
jgi:hypothetical protein